jgi:hypothetical protein
MCRATSFSITINGIALNGNSKYEDLGYKTAVFHAEAVVAKTGVIEVIYRVRPLATCSKTLMFLLRTK